MAFAPHHPQARPGPGPDRLLETGRQGRRQEPGLTRTGQGRGQARPTRRLHRQQRGTHQARVSGHHGGLQRPHHLHAHQTRPGLEPPGTRQHLTLPRPPGRHRTRPAQTHARAPRTGPAHRPHQTPGHPLLPGLATADRHPSQTPARRARHHHYTSQPQDRHQTQTHQITRNTATL